MLASWITWFYRRYQQYKDLGEVGEPVFMWLSGLHIPETYIAALVQVMRLPPRHRGQNVVIIVDFRSGYCGFGYLLKQLDRKSDSSTHRAWAMQAACRDKGWPLDKSTLYSKVTKFTDPSQIKVWLLILQGLAKPSICLRAACLFRDGDVLTPAFCSLKVRPRHGCYVSGLYLEGAGWDNKKSVLKKQDPKVCFPPLVVQCR